MLLIVYQGEIVALKRARIVVIGSNGAGKTSLVRRLADKAPGQLLSSLCEKIQIENQTILYFT